jgi:FkbM family methyltransferase
MATLQAGIPAVCDLCKPLIQQLPVGRGTLLRFLGGDSDDNLWRGEKQYRVFYDHTLQANVWADMADGTRRAHYYTGRYYEQRVQSAIKKLLRPGDTFIDIGANFGIYTLLASGIVGNTGQVYSFEPQKKLVEIIKAQLVINNMQNVTVHNVGLADEESELVLRNPVEHHTGTASFRSDETAGRQIDRVQVVRGETLLTQVPSSARVFIKIDVEGFEFKVLQGLQNLLKYENVAILVEITDFWLDKMGISSKAIYQMLEEAGFESYQLLRSPFQLGHQVFEIERSQTIPEIQHDALFIKPGFMKTL